jgi:hypothetical protein
MWDARRPRQALLLPGNFWRMGNKSLQFFGPQFLHQTTGIWSPRKQEVELCSFLGRLPLMLLLLFRQVFGGAVWSSHSFFFNGYALFCLFFIYFLLLLNWVYIVTFTKVFTIFNSWIHSLHSPLSPSPHSWNSFNRSHFSVFISSSHS